MSIAEKIKLIRETEGLGRKAFTDLIGASQRTLEGIEQRGSEPRSDFLMKITTHERFKKYTLWLMSNDTAPECGQIDPDTEVARRANKLKVG
ncbi:helix-turn-helix domain-containing protein [Mangrovitalea sediminis]|uniref:helix-turn-helix domain-containing protein n=1 Tax=Mangrovitalea sediminis TaxID=1982043 RepID=UPI000BE4FB3D|nr:helix-turn-helix transcriptional regulator [Mangrovitalea sediminis]